MEIPFLTKKQAPSQIPTMPTPEEIYAAGITTLKDVMAPASLEVSATFVRIGNQFSRTIFVYSYPRYLGANWFSPVINFDKIFDISIFIHPIETSVALKNFRKQVARVQAQLSEHEEKGMVRDPILETAFSDLEDLRDKLQTSVEKLFAFGLYITFYGTSEKDLEGVEASVIKMLENKMIYTKPALYQQEEGFNSTLPLNTDKLAVNVNLNTAPISTVFPFVSSDLTSNKGILYGINRHNNSLIIFDRFSLENGNMIIFAKSGGGKSYTTKLEVLRQLMMGADVIIIDPENEYKFLADAVAGSFIKISLTSPHHINPFDLPKGQKDEAPADILRSNIINLTGLLKMMLGQMTPEEEAILDKAIAETYAARDITPEADFSKVEPPLMSDLQTLMANMAGAQRLGDRLQKYTTGSWSGFLNQPSNVSVTGRLTVFSIRDMEDELRPVAMYIILHFIWNIVRSELKKRILLVDEAWVMMKHEDAASFLFGMVKRCRKYYLGITTITQDVSDFMNSQYGRPIVTNSSIQLLLKQSPASVEILQKTFNLTDEEKFLLLESSVGEGIFFAGLKRAAIKVIASYTEDQIVTSDPQQLMAIEKAKKELEEAEKEQK